MIRNFNLFIHKNWYWLVAFLFILAGKLALIHFSGSPIPFWDQWDGEGARLYKNLVAGTFTLDLLIIPHNEHRLLTNRLLSLFVFYLNGQRWNVLLEMTVNAVLHSATIITLLVLLSKPFEERDGKLIAAVGSVLFFVPVGWENTLHGFSSHFYFFILCSVIYLYSIHKVKTFSSKWLLILFIGVLSFFSLASGVITLGAGAAMLLFGWIKAKRKDHKDLLAAGLILAIAMGLYLITPVIGSHQIFKAKNIWDWISGALQNLSWPFPAPFAVLYLPSVWFIYSLLRKKERPSAEESFLAGMLIMLIATLGLLAYSRALHVVSSRYMDLMVPAIVINFVIALRAIQGNRYRGILLAGAIFVLALGVYIMVRQTKFGVTHRATTARAQLVNVSAYLCDGDLDHLLNKQPEEIPYPDPMLLQGFLDDPDFQTFLPEVINPSINPDLCDH